jgi:hypothetical protein
LLHKAEQIMARVLQDVRGIAGSTPAHVCVESGAA